MLEPVYRKKFKKDLHKMIKRGKPASKIKDIIEKLLKQEPIVNRVEISNTLYYNTTMKQEKNIRSR